MSRAVLALQAVAVDHQRMLNDFKAVPLSDGSLPLFDDLIEELDHRAAFHANEMIVMTTPVELEDRLATLKVVTDHESCTLKLGQDPVDGGKPDFFISGQKLLVDLLGAEMPLLTGLQDVENLQPWHCHLEPGLFDLLLVLHDLYLIRRTAEPAVCTQGNDAVRSCAVLSAFLSSHLYNRLMRRLVILGLTLLLSLALLTAGCARGNRADNPHRSSVLSNLPFVYKMTVQQGNIITEGMINQVELGMSPAQVRFLLGTPLLTDMFHTNRWDYVYTIRRGHEPMEIKRLTLWFEEDQLVSIEGFAQPDPGQALAEQEEEMVIIDVPDWRDDRGIITRTLNAVGVDTEE